MPMHQMLPLNFTEVGRLWQMILVKFSWRAPSLPFKMRVQEPQWQCVCRKGAQVEQKEELT
jgi:hypothetical protein